MGDLRNQGVLVVGGTGGVGHALVLLASQLGATVLFSVPPGSEAAAESLLALAQSAGAEDRISFAAIDLSSPSEVDRLFDQACERLPGLHVLVMNLAEHAHLFGGKSVIETTLSDWNEALSVHLRQPFLIAQRALEEFVIGRQQGRIVYVMAAIPGTDAPGHVSVAAAQSALGSFVRSIAKEYGRRGIACNAVVLRGHDSPQTIDDNLQPAYEPLVETVLFLASGEASFINGEVLEVTL